MKDIKIILLLNPFNPSDVEISYTTSVPQKTAYQYIQPLMMGEKDVVISCNGQQVDREYVPKSGDNLAVCATVGKGKNILATIAMIALAYYAPGIGQGLNGVAAGAHATFMGSLYTMGIMAVGGMIINAIFPPPKVDSSNTSSQVYGWQSGSVYAQGKALPTTFGKYRTQGVLLSQHISYDKKKQYMHLIYTGGQGAIDSISDIQINGNPIANYADYILETRLGTNDQETLANFPNNYADRSLSYELNTGKDVNGAYQKDIIGDWHTDNTDGNGGEAFDIVFSFPAGLYRVDNEGKYHDTYVDLEAQYRVYGSAGAWIPIDLGTYLVTKELWGNTIVMESATGRLKQQIKEAFSLTFSVDNLIPERYEVRTRCVAKESVDSKYINTVNWTQITSVIKTNFARPNKTIVALKILATDQLSGSTPTVTWAQTRSNVNVWNPVTGAYELQPANNPAWACYDIIHDCHLLKNISTGGFEHTVFGRPVSRLKYSDFKIWADYCIDQNLTFNYIFTNMTDFWGALKYPESIGRGKVVQRGTTFACICDKPSNSVQMFSVGNIGQSDFKESYIPFKDRADSVEITFYNKDKNYEQDIITVYGDNYDANNYSQNPTQITLDGCDNYEQAVLQGKYFLRLNKYLNRIVSFPADIDAIACTVGDVIIAGHDVLNMDEENEDTGGGRIVSATESTVVLDREVLMLPAKNYAITIQGQDDSIVQKEVIHFDGYTDTITINGTFSAIPAQYDIYNFGELESINANYRITNISRDGELRRKITALEYFDEIYTDDGIIPERYLQQTSVVKVPEITGALSTQQYYRQSDGTIVSNISFELTFPLSGGIKEVLIYYSLDNQVSWTLAGRTDSNLYTMPNAIVGKAYDFKFVAGSGAGARSTGYITTGTLITGKDEPPNPVTNLTYAEVTGGFLLSWYPSPDPDIAGYEIWIGSGNVGLGDCTRLVESVKATSFFAPISSSGAYTFFIFAVDNSKNTSTSVNLLATFTSPPTVTKFDVNRNNDNLDFKWNPVTVVGAQYEIRRGSSFSLSDLVVITSANSYSYFFPIAGTYTFWIKSIDQYGNYSDEATFVTTEVAENTNRNVILTIDQKNNQVPWNGVKFNCHEEESFGGLVLDANTIHGEHIVEINLPEKLAARNWIVDLIEGVSSDIMTWGSANFKWNSVEANTGWLPEGDITNAIVKHQISQYTGLPINVIESFPLDESLTGENTTNASESVSATDYRDARFRKGLYISDGTSVAWNVSIPSEFVLTFYVRKDTDFTDKPVFVTLTGTGVNLQIGYSTTTGKFYLSDGNNLNEVSVQFRTQDVIQFGIVQKASERKFLVQSLATSDAGISSLPLTPAGALTNIALYPK